MRLVIVVPDGMADRADDFADGRTPLEIAATPQMDAIASEGECGVAVTVPESVEPGSDVANMAVLGVNPEEYRVGRAAIEAAGRALEVAPDQVVFRMNLVTIENGRMADYSAGSITTEDARPIVEAISAAIAPLQADVTAGVSYRHLMRVKDPEDVLSAAKCYPPHDITGKEVEAHLPTGAGSDRLRSIMTAAAEAIAGMSDTANAIWLWGQGKAASLPSLRDRYGVNGAVITAVDLVKGLGRAMGMSVIEVAGATGDLDTNYAGKADAAVEALDTHDLVFVHVEAPDEASHRGNMNEKITAIEAVDREVLTRLRRAASKRGDTRLLVVPDHLTPLAIRTHAHGAVPYALCGPGIDPSNADGFCERTASSTGVVCERGWELCARALDGKDD